MQLFMERDDQIPWLLAKVSTNYYCEDWKSWTQLISHFVVSHFWLNQREKYGSKVLLERSAKRRITQVKYKNQ